MLNKSMQGSTVSDRFMVPSIGRAFVTRWPERLNCTKSHIAYQVRRSMARERNCRIPGNFPGIARAAGVKGVVPAGGIEPTA
jgi:hypothetical protein